MLIGLWSADWLAVGASLAAERLAGEAPRLAVGKCVIWADGRGLDARELAVRLQSLAALEGEMIGAGLAATPILAQLAARHSAAADGTLIEVSDGRVYLADRSLTELVENESLLGMLDAVGIMRCGELAVLEREAVEVRFGPELIEIWRHTRGEDHRRLFLPVASEPPHASVDFIDYVITDPERLIFATNALLGGMCERMRTRGEHARRATLALSLANGQGWSRTLRPARPTANRHAWLRLMRTVLERLTVPDAVTGIGITLGGLEAAAAVQGDLFDRGFASASAVEAALARLIEAQGTDVIVQADVSKHPMAERRTRWEPRVSTGDGENEAMPEAAPARAGFPDDDDSARLSAGALTLQLLPEPREVLVETIRRRDHNIPVRYRDGHWQQLVTAAGPDRVSGGRWEPEPYAREYFRAVTTDGLLIWLFRDARKETWFLHGWWD